MHNTGTYIAIVLGLLGVVCIIAVVAHWLLEWIYGGDDGYDDDFDDDDFGDDDDEYFEKMAEDLELARLLSDEWYETQRRELSQWAAEQYRIIAGKD
jgi:hypothetical protein